MINKRYIINKKLAREEVRYLVLSILNFQKELLLQKFYQFQLQLKKTNIYRRIFTLQKLEHPNILKAFELSTIILIDDEEDNEIEKFSLFITMEYFPATDVLNYSKLSEENI